MLALSGDPAVLPEILELADALELGHPPVTQATKYNQGRIDLRLIPFYNRIINVCFAIEQMPDARQSELWIAISTTASLAGMFPGFPKRPGRRSTEGSSKAGWRPPWHVVAREEALRSWPSICNDVHPMLAEYARGELTSILKRDYGWDRRQWETHFERQTFPVAPTPSRRDAVEW